MVTQRASDGAKIGFLGVGYGIYENGWFHKKYGKRHYAPLVVDTVNDGAFRASGAVSKICKGDSGGAVLQDVGGQREVVGIFSHGNSVLKALISPCNGKIWSTRVDVYTPWIEETLQQLCDDGVRPLSMCELH